MVASYGHGRTVLVRSDEGQVVGTGTLLPRPNNRAEVLRMSVASEFRREGIGASIIAELMDTARRWSAEYVVLETTSSWRAAVEFYLNCGFTITHIEEARFGSGTWFEMPLSAD
jgi:GNAT superfamily N-acetyltransferase